MIKLILRISISLVLSQGQLLILSEDFKTPTFTSNSGWNQIGATNNIQLCSDGSNMISIYGATYFGQDVLIYKSFDIPPHYQIQIEFQFWIIDTQSTYQLNFYVDDQVIGIITESDLIFTQNFCGDTYYDSYATFTFVTTHINSFATVVITSTINQPITTWGIRNFVFRFAPCPEQCIQCQDSTSTCNIWQFQIEFWTTPLLSGTEGWIYTIGNYQTVECIGQSFIKINQIGDQLTYNMVTKPNYKFRIQFNILKAGSFVMEKIIFSINSQIQYQQTFNNEQYQTQCSGSMDGDQIINFSQDFLYSQFNTNSLLLSFSSDVSSTSRFFGLRNFYTFIAPCLPNCLLCTTSSDCQQCDIDYSFDGTECKTTVIASPSIYSLYQTQQNIDLKNFTTATKTFCGAFNLFGGYQQSNIMVINMTDMPFHNQLKIKISIIAIDKWESQSTLQLSLDGQQYNLINRNKYDNKNKQNLCGNSIWSENQHDIDITLNHYSSFLLINFKFLPLTTYSFGVLSVSIDYYYCGPKFKCAICDVTGTLCLQCSDVNRLLINDCECTNSPGIQTSMCPDCNLLQAENQMYCPSIYACNRGENYIPYCQSCISGFTYDSALNYCVYNGLTVIDQFSQNFIYSIFNTPTYSHINDITFYDKQGVKLSSPILGSCGSQQLLGGIGFDGAIEMNFNNVPPFRRIRVNYIIYLIDVDEGLKLNHFLNYAKFNFIDWNPIPKTQNLCGSSKPEFVTKIDYMLGASGTFNYKVRLDNLINSNLMGSFGIYNINVYYQPCADQIRCKTCDDNGCLTCSVPERIQSPQCLCPTYEYMNYAQCPTCPYKCQTNSCNLQGCLVCANPQRGSPPDCLCSTYEIYGEPSCPLCQQNCLYCTQTMCLQCTPGYYAYGEFCFKCPYQCETCLLNGCLKCSNFHRGPAPFCRCPTYEIIGQAQCPECPQNCKACDQNGCLVCKVNRELPSCDCLSNYYEINDECVQCQNNCKTCDQYQCLTCHRTELVLPNCSCPLGSVDINSQCIFDKVIIKSYGYFDQSLKNIIISFDTSFIIIGLENQQNFVQENCVMIKNSLGTCQIFNQKIIYQFDQQNDYSLGDILELDKQFFSFLNKGNFEIQNIQLQLNPQIDYYPVFDIAYPQKILSCKLYNIMIENVLNIGYKVYVVDVINEQSIDFSIQNNVIAIKSRVTGEIQIGIKVTNFVNKSSIQQINILVVSDNNLEFEVFPQLGQINRYSDLIIPIQNIRIENCVNITKHSKYLMDINFSNLIKLQLVTNKSKYQFSINLGMLELGQKYTLNVTISSLQLVNTIIKNYTITQVKPYFSILGGNRMVYYNNRLNVTAVIVDPDNQGLMCKWQCIKLTNQQDCEFNFTSHQSQLIEKYQLELYQTYQFIYDCLGNKVYTNYYITDINQDQLFIFYPIIYSNHVQNQQNPIQYYIYNESSRLSPLIYQNISIRIIQNQSIIKQNYQENSFGQQYLSDLEGNILIQAQLNQMISSINISLFKQDKIFNISLNIEEGTVFEDMIHANLSILNQLNPPYLFQYLAQINSQVTYQLTEWSQYSDQKFILPQGVQSNNYSIQIIIQVMDGNGFTQNTSKSVIILPQNVSNQMDQYLYLFQNRSIDQVTLGYQFLQLQEDGCLSNCSNHGICQQNKCICYADYYLNDCSANYNQFQNLTNKINNLIISLIKQNFSNNIYKNLIYQLLQNQFIKSNINIEILELIINETCFQFSEYINKQSIQNSVFEIFIKNIPQIEQILINYENMQNLNSLLNIQDLSFGLVGFDSLLTNQTIDHNQSSQHHYNMKLLNITKQFSLYMGLQQYIDQEPYKFDGQYMNIISQKVSTNYSQKFFNIPLLLKNEINDSICQLQNESIISTIVYKTNPYLADQNFPYKETNTQVASIQLYDSRGFQYRSSIPLYVTHNLNQNNSTNNPVCMAQQGELWISNICNTIKLTNQTLCSCDTIDQQSIVNDVNNLYASSNIQMLIQIENFLYFEYQKSYIVIILAGFTLCSFLFSYVGYKRDQIDVQKYNQHKQLRDVKKQIDYDSEEEEIILSQDIKRFKKRNVRQEILAGLKKLHSFLRIYNEFLIDQPRPSRYVMFFLKQCILLSLTAVFGKGFSIIQNIFLSIISIILLTPIEKVIMVAFSFNASNKIKVIIQGFIIIVFLSCWYICISVSAGVGTEKSNNWSFIFMLSFFINLTIVEALSIVLKIIFSPFIDKFIQKGNCLARFVYFYLYDFQALAIVREINNYERPTILTTRE